MCFYTKVNNNVLLSNNDVILECQICPQRIVIRSSSKKIDNFEDQVRYEKRALEKRLSQMTKTWWEAPMGGSVLSFLKAE
jgi:metal-responsive CopG/Arc/MetJ family transcriptional regulator